MFDVRVEVKWNFILIFVFNLKYEQSREVAIADRTFPSIQPKPEPPNSNVIYSCTFNTDGSLLFVVIADILVVYNSENG